MDYISLVLAMAASASVSMMSSLFGKRSTGSNNSCLYSVIATCSAAVTWGMVCLWKGGIHSDALGYSLAYGLFHTAALIGMFKAYQTGSVSLTAFIKQLSLIAVSLWGFAFWGNSLTCNIAIGLMLIVSALYLCFKPDPSGAQKPSLTWCLFASMLLVGNAGASITLKYYQLAFRGSEDSSFMFFGTASAFAASLLLYLKSGSGNSKSSLKGAVCYPVMGGIANVLLNLLTLRLLASPLPESVIFPGIAAGGLSLTMLFSVIVFKERLSARQWCGLLVGTIALVFLNIA